MDINSSFRNFDLWPIKTQKGLSHTYTINMYGRIHQNENGLNDVNIRKLKRMASVCLFDLI